MENHQRDVEIGRRSWEVKVLENLLLGLPANHLHRGGWGGVGLEKGDTPEKIWKSINIALESLD